MASGTSPSILCVVESLEGALSSSPDALTLRNMVDSALTGYVEIHGDQLDAGEVFPCGTSLLTKLALDLDRPHLDGASAREAARTHLSMMRLSVRSRDSAALTESRQVSTNINVDIDVTNFAP